MRATIRTSDVAAIDISAELFARLQAKAQAEGRTVDELALDALRDSLGKETITEKATRFSQKKADRVKYTPEQAPDVVHEWRKEQRGR